MMDTTGDLPSSLRKSKPATRSPVAVCTYDNPATWARECWQDGKLLCHYAARLLPPFAKLPIPGHLFFFGANIGPWETGQMVGDPSAITGTGP